MLYLAKNKKVVSSTELSQNTAISKRYLMQIAAKLRDGKLVGVSMGMTGGYYLLKEPDNISVYDIIVLMEGEIRVTNAPDEGVAYLTLYQAFNDLQHRIYHYLSSLTLDVLVHQSWSQCLKLLTDTLEPYYEAVRIKAAQEL